MARIIRRRRKGRKRKKARKRKVITNPMNRANATVLPSPYAGNTLLKNKVFIKLRYAERFSLNPGAASLAAYVFYANGMYNPGVPAGDHQPRGFDQMMALYDHYTVLSNTITVSTGGTPGQNPSVFGISLKDSVAVQNASNYLEDYISNNIFGVNTEANPHTLTMNFSSKKFLGPGVFDDNRRGDAGQNPPETASFHVYSFPIDTGADASSKWFLAIMDYYVMFSEPITPGES